MKITLTRVLLLGIGLFILASPRIAKLLGPGDLSCVANAAQSGATYVCVYPAGLGKRRARLLLTWPQGGPFPHPKEGARIGEGTHCGRRVNFIRAEETSWLDQLLPQHSSFLLEEVPLDSSPEDVSSAPLFSIKLQDDLLHSTSPPGLWLHVTAY